MSNLNEMNSTQAPIIDAMHGMGWTIVHGADLKRADEQVLVEGELVAALVRLNPFIAEEPDRADEVVRMLRAVMLSGSELVEMNQEFYQWLTGTKHVRLPGMTHDQPVKLIDFQDVSKNVFVVSDEVRFGTPGHIARFDIVLWVNGIPLVVGEAKSAVNSKVSWFNGVSDLVNDYQPGWPQFFVPNLAMFSSDGRELVAGAVGAPTSYFIAWGPVQEHPSLADVLDKARNMMEPAKLLTLLADYVLFERDDADGTGKLSKVLGRYMQVEAVEKIGARIEDGTVKRGLARMATGVGKTVAMVFAAGKALKHLHNPTVILLADRIQLVDQAAEQFRAIGLPRLLEPETSKELFEMLGSHSKGGQDRRGLVFTTVHKFKGAPKNLNDRDSIVILVDEAHRTQEGSLGMAMRAALPNAFMFAFTGTAIATLTHNTFEAFGHEGDDDRILHDYPRAQAIADGVVVPIHVAPRLVSFHLDKDGINAAFDELATQEGLDDEEKEVLAKRASRTSTFFLNPERVKAVVSDVLDHFYSTVDPLGMKAQVVVYDRPACVAYDKEFKAQMAARGLTDEVAVVMSVQPGKGVDEAWKSYAMTPDQENALLDRFRTQADPLKFLIVTSKLGTGFNAPIEGVLYLDKVLQEHTLEQTVSRTNRTWTNKDTGQEKKYGLIVDYVGVGDGFGVAMAGSNPNQTQRSVEVDGLIDTLVTELPAAMKRFAGIDYEHPDSTTLIEAQKRVPSGDREDFALEYLMLSGIWETAWPDPRLVEHRPAYGFLSRVYASLQPPDTKDELLWKRHGAKTLALVHEHMSDITIDASKPIGVIADVDTLAALEAQGLLPELKDVENLTAAEALDSIAARLKKRMEGAAGGHAVYKSLAERLDHLRKQSIAAAEASIAWLEELLRIARALKAAEKAEDENGQQALDVLDPRIGALTQIFEQYAPPDTPEAIERVVAEVDLIAKAINVPGWTEKQGADREVRRDLRQVLKKYGLHTVSGLFDAAYEYIAEHY